MSDTPNCPWCGARLSFGGEDPLRAGFGYAIWLCESSAELRDGRLTDDLPRTQSDTCRLQELEDELKQLRAREEQVRKFLLEIADMNTVPIAKWVREQAWKLAVAGGERLREADWLWDDRDLEAAIRPDEAGKYDEPGDIVKYRPVHELPTRWALVTATGVRWFDSEEDAKAAKAEGGKQ